MYKKPSRRWVALKAAYLLPLSALALVAFARPQTLGEIEKRVEQTAPAVAETVTAAVKTVAQHLPTLAGATERTDEAAFSQQNGGTATPQPTPAAAASAAPTDTAYVTGSDANLVRADLAESGHFATTTRKTPTELLDSTMLAVGARKIAEGTYVGHFQPSLSSDTVRIARAVVLDRQSKQTGEHRFACNADSPNAYNITLNAETRKDRTGYYIRYMQPVASAQRHYDRKTVDPYMLSTDSVLTGRRNSRIDTYVPVAIERNKKETRIYMYVGFLAKSPVDMWRQQNTNHYSDMTMVDERTGDRYVCRATDYTYFKYVKDEPITYKVDGQSRKDTVNIYQICLVFPPLDKNMNEAYFGSIEDDGRYSTTFELDQLPRKGRVITH